MMHPDGGEARKITDAKDGVSTFAFSKDGKWLVYRSGKAGEEQLYRVPVAGIDSAKAEQITRHPTGVGIWRFAPTGNRIYFITADTIDLDEKLRREKRFTVNIRNPETPLSSLWAFDVDGKKTTRLTKDTIDHRHRLRDRRTTASGSRSAASRRTATSGTSPNSRSTATTSCSTSRAVRSSG